MPTLTKTTIMRLPVTLSKDEIDAFGRQNAREVENLLHATNEKKKSAAHHKDIIERLQAEVERLTAIVNTGQDERDVECEIEYDFRQNMAHITRNDTGEFVESRAMTYDERQLKMEFAEQPA